MTAANASSKQRTLRRIIYPELVLATNKIRLMQVLLIHRNKDRRSLELSAQNEGANLNI